MKNILLKILLCTAFIITSLCSLANFSIFRESSFNDLIGDPNLNTYIREEINLTSIQIDQYTFELDPTIVEDYLTKFTTQLIPYALYEKPIYIDTTPYFDTIHDQAYDFIYNIIYETIYNYLIDLNISLLKAQAPNIPFNDKLNIDINAVLFLNLTTSEKAKITFGQLTLENIEDISLRIVSKYSDEIDEALQNILTNELENFNTNIITNVDNVLDTLNFNYYLERYRQYQYFNLLLLGVSLVISVALGWYYLKKKQYKVIFNTFFLAALFIFILSFALTIFTNFIPTIHSSALTYFIQNTLYYYLRYFVLPSLAICTIYLIYTLFKLFKKYQNIKKPQSESVEVIDPLKIGNDKLASFTIKEDVIDIEEDNAEINEK